MESYSHRTARDDSLLSVRVREKEKVGRRQEKRRKYGLPPADPEDAPGKQVDLVSASVVVVGVIAALLFCLLVPACCSPLGHRVGQG